MSIYTYNGFLCASFSYDASLKSFETLLGNEWQSVTLNRNEIKIYEHYFYPEFVEFSYSAGTSRYCLSVDRKLEFDGLTVNVKYLNLYLMPYGVALYSIHVEIESDSLNDITFVMSRLRNVHMRADEKLERLHNEIIKPVKQAAARLGHKGVSIVENGNKYKVFQIVTADSADAFGNSIGDTLFEVATLSKIGGCAAGDSNSPSREYVDKILHDHRLSFYNNWTGLALNDTFSILAYEVQPWILKSWIDDYFSMIYIHGLFCKFYLFRLNSRFREYPERGEKFEDEFNEFERLYTFNRISYNFMPEEIDRAIDRSLQISEEKRLLSGYIKKCNKQQADNSSKRLDRILTFLAIVTVASTIWDFSSMVDAMWPFSELAGSTQMGFRIVVGLTLLFLVVMVILILRPRKK